GPQEAVERFSSSADDRFVFVEQCIEDPWCAREGAKTLDQAVSQVGSLRALATWNLAESWPGKTCSVKTGSIQPKNNYQENILQNFQCALIKPQFCTLLMSSGRSGEERAARWRNFSSSTKRASTASATIRCRA